MLVACAAAAAAAAASATATAAPVANTTGGVVRGAYGSGGISIFRGMHYAAPPTGTQRWMPPMPAAPWSGTKDALKDGDGCPQACHLPSHTCPPTMSEDCLWLNVFTPATSSSSSKKKILFFIHGGDFTAGYAGGPLYDGTSFARDHDVMVVVANYRLGALGFLYSGSDPTAHFTGNFGLLDQQLALEWVQKNAASFGGDPSQVTIFGQSAGAMSVACHLTMPSSAHLFARAILQSDPLALPFRTEKNFPKFTKEVAKKASCASSLSSKPYEHCMRGLTWQQVVDAQQAAAKDLIVELGHFLDMFVAFSPTVETPMLADQPFKAMLEGKMQDKPIMLGSVANEGVIFIHSAFPSSESRTIEDGLLTVAYGATALFKLLKQYPRSEHDKHAHDMRNHTAKVATDSLFHCSIRHAALALSGMTERTSPTWVYHFEQVPTMTKIWLPDYAYCSDVVCHSADLPYVFRANMSLAFANVSFSPEEAVMAETMQTYWAQFAKDAAPASSWPKYGATYESAMRFRAATPSGANGTAAVNGEFTAKCGFWDDLGYKWIL